MELFKINLRQQVGLGQSMFKIYFASMVWEEMSFMSIEFIETDLKLSVSTEYRLCGRIPARVVDRTREE